MAIEVIKKGNFTPLKYEGTCKNCGCEVICDESDLTNFYTRKQIKCPECKHTIVPTVVLPKNGL